MSKMQEISELVQKGRSKEIVGVVQSAIDNGEKPNEIINDGLLAGMAIVGQKFKNEEIFVPEVLIAARAMNKGIEVLKPYLQDNGNVSKGKIVLGTVKGDLHDIGKNLVRIMMEGKGIEVIDLGTDVSAETFIEEAKNNNVDIICCSALLTTTMPEMEKVVQLVKNNHLDFKIMIGGAPVNQEFCDQIGADYYTADAATAADVASQIIGGKSC
ncbi:MAG: corrinoid protein [Thomasclavelia sp.]|jgi:corrinoid protein of di/trimethylamine methyltransferase|nr:corrinoid protein [Thomasclavelia sp.]